MSKLERFILIFIGFAVFLVAFTRIGFLFGIPINQYTLIFAFITYILSLVVIFSTQLFSVRKNSNFLSLVFFILSIPVLILFSILFSKTYDTSWDGQGYHQTAVIAYADGWNPIYQPNIKLIQRLPSQIFSEGYPPALWEIEATIYSLSGNINSAKVVNIAVLIISNLTLYILLRKLKINRYLSILFSLLVTIQPIFMIQLLTFMEDGFGYQLLIIAIASLAINAISSKYYWSIPVFLMTELLLVSTKYNNLPIALALTAIFLVITFNRILNKEYKLINFKKIYFVSFILISLIFAILPYGRNFIYHKALFYPANYSEYSGAITYNNVPLNLRGANRLTLLFYGIFSKTQTALSGDPRHDTNVAQLKIPFSISQNEIEDSTALFNNRVGAGGIFFSGVILLSFLFLIFTLLKTRLKKERYVIYSVFFSLLVTIALSLSTPAPNLLRYVTQIQLIPFIILIPIYAVYRSKTVKYLSLFILLIALVNTIIYGYALTNRKINEFEKINKQFAVMAKTPKAYHVKAQHFYSSYIILKEKNVPYEVVNYINCYPIKELLASSTTTQYCIK